MTLSDQTTTLPELTPRGGVGAAAKVTGSFALTSEALSGVRTLYVMDGGDVTIDDGVTVDTDAVIYLSGNMTVNGTLTLGPDARIKVGPDARIFGNGVMRGDGASFEAPRKCVFADEIHIEGSWNQDKTYVAWFSARTDDAIAINNAIVMQHFGDVYLEKRKYEISSPIIVNAGIRLHGVSSCNQYAGSDPGQITFIQATDDLAENSYMIELKIKLESAGDVSKKPSPPNDCTTIENLWICGGINKGHRGIFADGGGYKLYRIMFRQLSQALKQTREYADSRTLSALSYWSPSLPIDTSLPAFDLSGPGDNLLIENIHVTGTTAPLLRVADNCGTIIQSCILNGLVLIKSAKAVTFVGNHMETADNNNRTATLKVDDSTIAIRSCYMEKGKYPSIILMSNIANASVTVADISDCVFAYQSGHRENGDLNTEDMMKNRIEGISEYDVCINIRSLVNLSNNYRYDIRNVSETGQQNTLGIWLCAGMYGKATGLSDIVFSDLPSINSYSGWISQQCAIAGKAIASPLPEIMNPAGKGASVGHAGVSQNVKWVAEHGKYRYYYCYITPSQSASGLSYSNFVDTGEIEVGSDKVAKSLPTNGVYFSVMATRIGVRCRVALKRERVSTDGTIVQEVKYVILPVCGGQVYYDNGIAVGGYKWQTLENLKNQ